MNINRWAKNLKEGTWMTQNYIKTDPDGKRYVGVHSIHLGRKMYQLRNLVNMVMNAHIRKYTENSSSS
jgi:hypothetical protein